MLARTQKGTWEAQGQAEEMHAAVSAAKEMAGSSRFKGVKVDQTFFDKTNGRQVSSTIFEHGGARNGPPLILWLGLALVAGAASFALTYGLAIF